MLIYQDAPDPCQCPRLTWHSTPITREVCRTGVGKPYCEERHAIATLTSRGIVQVTCQAGYQVTNVEHLRPHRWLLMLTDTAGPRSCCWCRCIRVIISGVVLGECKAFPQNAHQSGVYRPQPCRY